MSWLSPIGRGGNHWLGICCIAFFICPAAQAGPPAGADPTPGEIVITASTVDLLGKATTSSQGSVTALELEQRPAYRVGQLLETIPGLTVTAHSGEGKANQYLLRGFNLDHGTDLATTIDEIPVNMRTHAHGQGYTDLNFLIPELAGGVDFSKGPYAAAAGDFSSVGADHIRFLNVLRPTLSISGGTVGDYRAFVGGSADVGPQDHLLAAGEVAHLDGPWDNADDFRKYNAALRWSRGSGGAGISLTALAYGSTWRATTDQPLRAIEQGLIGRFGSLDPSDGGRSSRQSVSATYAEQVGGWAVRANLYLVHQQLTLWNDFTHFLDDPINGDQHAQHDRRTFGGGALQAARDFDLAGVDNTFTIGGQGRWDAIDVDLVHTVRRAALDTVRDDGVREGSAALFLQADTRWTPWLRSSLGLRDDYFYATDDNRVGGLSGHEHASLFQPKGSFILGPWAKTEFYISAGRGFHSNDVRAGTIEGGGNGGTAYQRPPFLVRSAGYEIGVRTSAVRHLTAAMTLFRIDFDSELTYDADAGATEAGRPSRRIGAEFTAQYRPVHWLELNANLAVSRARYRDHDSLGDHIEDAPGLVASAGLLINGLGRWFGSLALRDLGSHPLVEDNSVRSKGYRELNANVGYRLSPRVKVEIDLFNLLNSHDDAADYYYTTRLQGETASGADGIQAHPLEPRSSRLTLSVSL